jgi:hypothetical protein
VRAAEQQVVADQAGDVLRDAAEAEFTPAEADDLAQERWRKAPTPLPCLPTRPSNPARRS